MHHLRPAPPARGLLRPSLSASWAHAEPRVPTAAGPVFVVMQALWSLGRDGERVVKALCGVDLNVEWNGSEKNRIVARAGSSVMAEQCAALEYLYDMIILGLRQEIMMQGSNDPRVFAELDDIRVNPDFQACVRKSLREADPAFPNCDTLRGQLGWDVWQ